MEAGPMCSETAPSLSYMYYNSVTHKTGKGAYIEFREGRGLSRYS